MQVSAISLGNVEIDHTLTEGSGISSLQATIYCDFVHFHRKGRDLLVRNHWVVRNRDPFQLVEVQESYHKENGSSYRKKVWGVHPHFTGPEKLSPVSWLLFLASSTSVLLLCFSPPLRIGFLALFPHDQSELPSTAAPSTTSLQSLGLNSKFRAESTSTCLGVGHTSTTDWIFWTKWIGWDGLILDTVHSRKWLQ